MPYYDPNDYEKFVDGMKIIPLQTNELKSIIINEKKYKELYGMFDRAFKADMPPHKWYKEFLENGINC